MDNLKSLRQLASLISKVSKKYFVLLVLLGIFGAGSMFLTIFIPKIIIDSLVSGGNRYDLLKLIGLCFVIKYILVSLAKILELGAKKESKVLSNRVMDEFSKKTLKLDYSRLESSKVLDLRERAIFAINNYGALDNLMAGLQNAIIEIFVLITTLGIIWKFSFGYLILIVSLVGVSLYINKRMVKKTFVETQKIIPINREFGYYVSSALGDKNQKDYRLYNMSAMITDKIDELNHETIVWLEGLYRINGRGLMLQSLVAYGVKIIAYSYTSIRGFSNISANRIGIGDFVFYISSTEKLFGSFEKLAKVYVDLVHTVDVLKPFQEFMDLEESKSRFGSKKIASFESLEFDKVNFTYPETDKLILNNVSFRIEKAEKISIVGLNNAGKSTIVKLICGFFQVDSGEIRVNGVNINDYNYDDYMGLIAPVFQDFKLFPFSVGENISLSESDLDGVLESLGKVDLLDKIRVLPQGLNSKLEKSIYEDGVDFSGGEKQKLAIARALYKEGDLIILDEPTSALDPLAESEIYEDFSRLVKDKTTIYISHRMSSSLLSDKILLLNNSVVEDFDSHKNLMKNNKLYRDLFLAQANNFN